MSIKTNKHFLKITEHKATNLANAPAGAMIPWHALYEKDDDGEALFAIVYAANPTAAIELALDDCGDEYNLVAVCELAKIYTVENAAEDFAGVTIN